MASTRLRLTVSGLVALLSLSGPHVYAQGQNARSPGKATGQERADWVRLAIELGNQHPAEYYRRAKDLFLSGRRNEATFIFYLGQLRYRVYFAANPNLLKDGDPALFSSLSKVVGRPINQYAFGDLPVLERTIQAVLAFGQAYPDRFTSPGKAPRKRQEIRQGLADMRTKILAEGDSVRAERMRSGLGNRN